MVVEEIDRSIERVLQEQMPPIARKVILIDFDGTIAPFGYMFEYPEPFPGVAKFTQELRKKGYSIGIFTSRLSPTWLEDDNQDYTEQYKYIQNYCTKNDIYYNFITAEKVPCEAYIDDKAIYFDGNWAPIAERWAINVTE